MMPTWLTTIPIFPIRIPFPAIRVGSLLPYSVNGPFKNSLMALFRLAWSSKLQIPLIITICFMAFDIRLQLEINIFWEANHRQNERMREEVPHADYQAVARVPLYEPLGPDESVSDDEDDEEDSENEDEDGKKRSKKSEDDEEDSDNDDNDDNRSADTPPEDDFSETDHNFSDRNSDGHFDYHDDEDDGGAPLIVQVQLHQFQKDVFPSKNTTCMISNSEGSRFITHLNNSSKLSLDGIINQIISVANSNNQADKNSHSLDVPFLKRLESGFKKYQNAQITPNMIHPSLNTSFFKYSPSLIWPGVINNNHN